MLERQILESIGTEDFNVIKVVSDQRNQYKENLSGFLNELSSYSNAELIISSLDHLEDYVSETDSLLKLFDVLIENRIGFSSIEDGISLNEHAHWFIQKLVLGVENAKKLLKSTRIRQARIAAKNAGEQVGAIKKRDDDLIRELRNQGLTIREIAKKLGLSTFPISEALKNNA